MYKVALGPSAGPRRSRVIHPDQSRVASQPPLGRIRYVPSALSDTDPGYETCTGFSFSEAV